MTIEQIKKKMEAYRDFYGGDLLNIDDIKDCNSKKELAELLDKHRRHQEAMLSDAHGHLDKFKRKLGLEYAN